MKRRAALTGLESLAIHMYLARCSIGLVIAEGCNQRRRCTVLLFAHSTAWRSSRFEIILGSGLRAPRCLVECSALVISLLTVLLTSGRCSVPGRLQTSAYTFTKNFTVVGACYILRLIIYRFKQFDWFSLQTIRILTHNKHNIDKWRSLTDSNTRENTYELRLRTEGKSERWFTLLGRTYIAGTVVAGPG
jgi:hypothetical protein